MPQPHRAALGKEPGGFTPAYFQEVRTASLKHWLNFDRHTMFHETEEAGAASR